VFKKNVDTFEGYDGKAIVVLVFECQRKLKIFSKVAK
tara:strand:+ start:806 stop:916 length:111 start_codon:yes stop_codon:yes gene_type:complete